MTPLRFHRVGLLFACLVLTTSIAACRREPYREVEIERPEAGRGDASTAAPAAPAAPPPLRVAVAGMQTPRDTFHHYGTTLESIARRLGRSVVLVQRGSYREVNDLVAAGRVDVAYLCTGGYLDLLRRAPETMEILAVPVISGLITYNSVVLVPASSSAQRIEDLEGRSFAFTDPLSLTGHRYVTHVLRGRGRAPREFFGQTMFTGSHDRAIRAVAREIVDGASVDELILIYMAEYDPELRRQVRVVHRSPPFGMPPVVAATTVPAADRQDLRETLLTLHLDPAGGAAMKALHFDRFVVPPPALYDSAIAVVAESP